MIRHFEQISGTEYYLPAIEAWCETQRRGHGENGRSLSISWDDRVSVTIGSDGILQSLIVWKYLKWAMTAYITQGWTAPAFRRMGLYSALYRSVKKEAKKLGAKIIDGGISPANKSMLNAAKKQGRTIGAIWMKENL
jgi:hypothetical protein